MEHRHFNKAPTFHEASTFSSRSANISIKLQHLVKCQHFHNMLTFLLRANIFIYMQYLCLKYANDVLCLIMHAYAYLCLFIVTL
jgi:hypothetical protein